MVTEVDLAANPASDTAATWETRVVGSPPAARGGHAMAFDEARGQVVMFGGFAGGSQYLNDTWIWDGNTWQQKAPSIAPSARAVHAMVYDVVRSQIILFGGSGYANYSDTWSWDGNKWEQKIQSSSPSARFFCAMVYDASHEEGVLFGGVSDMASFDETWVWDGRKWERKLPALSPPALASHAMAYDAAHRQVMLFGGAVNDRFFNDTWIWNGGASTQTTLSLAAGGAVSTSTLGPAGDLIAGYATGTVTSGTAPCGTAVFTYRQDGVVVSEAGVPMSTRRHPLR
jgi:hypothetical protein